ncbi:hypothetical protein RIF29_24987 [Crotalaria pallida]|uniref:Uncharacterized protein n=1 Tax=Crotalaria pallida TaxID=3830 RepID=A0AAN9EQT9_CROPI
MKLNEAFSDSMQDSKLEEENTMTDNTEVIESFAQERMLSDNIESPKHKINNGSCTVAQPDSIEEAQDMNLDISIPLPATTLFSGEVSNKLSSTYDTGLGQ